jgi:two-component system phosphate regulon sensor histidine kinase PhoR
VHIQDGMPDACVDCDAIEQAILNLLSNAMKYSGDARDIDLCLLRRGGNAVIQVSDHGTGIDPQEQKKIFEKFYRVSSPENKRIAGTGLGLALVAHTVKAHSGRIEVASMPGKGSTFSIFLPLEGKP